MEDEESSSNRPSIGFPLGLGLLLIMLFCMVAFYAACLHWDKLRSLLQSSPDVTSDLETNSPNSPRKPASPHKMPKKGENRSLSVLMPGDQVPKFIAIACPCRPPLHTKGSNWSAQAASQISGLPLTQLHV
ncbi:uncharacterized protein At5g65660-like [Juglans microcarpa x Juglans regia]|uniref:Hydroxyproline-rich glycoprotein family protein n=2 Tax=Juglans regia TaxID=51240 RepID=A0A833X1A9_JUGRE|nr:uncharacterized protein At5g65660-like [Juglans regia]XP_041016445.1 uncharacterized protein At5g65660-like [Juglans microcarpa x Juglans regia]KAF5455919.1 hypothetical protein F2P56_025447 [Juglans regia]